MTTVDRGENQLTFFPCITLVNKRLFLLIGHVKCDGRVIASSSGETDTFHQIPKRNDVTIGLLMTTPSNEYGQKATSALFYFSLLEFSVDTENSNWKFISPY